MGKGSKVRSKLRFMWLFSELVEKVTSMLVLPSFDRLNYLLQLFFPISNQVLSDHRSLCPIYDTLSLEFGGQSGELGLKYPGFGSMFPR